MADRVTGETAEICADIRGYTNETVALTLSNPYGNTEVGPVNVSGNGFGRYIYTTNDALSIPGEWTATWVYNNATVLTQRFTVGPRLPPSHALYDLRNDVARRVVHVYEGYVQDAQERSVSDPNMIGGPGDYSGYWLVPDPDSDDKGRFFLVNQFNGTALDLAKPFWTTPSDNDRFTLMDVPPMEVDRAIRLAIKEQAHLARIPVTLPEAPVDDDNIIDLPTYLTHVIEVWEDDDDEGHVRLANRSWDVKPGRKLYVDTEEDNVIINCLTSASIPLWEDSLVDLDTAAVISRAAFLLHANRAGSSTIDLEEHLRRQLAAGDEYERARRAGVGRIPSGARRILE